MSIVFGPVSSRRFGRSLGVDLSPDKKSCNFDCVYCELTASKTVDKISDPISIEEIIKEVSAALKIHKDIDVITLTANGEPTLYPNLKELICRLNLIKDSAKLLILSNGTGVLNSKIYDAILALDIVKFSLDSAIQKTFRKIDRGDKKLIVSDLIEKMSEFRNEFKGELVLEILVVKGFNDTKDEFEALNLAINKIAPSRVDISTIDRPPAYPVKGVNRDTLEEIAGYITNIPCVIASAKYGDKMLDFTKEELLELSCRRPQSDIDVKNSFSEISKHNLNELIKDGKIYETNVSGVKFYKIS
ncbi:radical SAM protein [Campylobacter sp. RM16190]|uniref:radical SAM protein n=1 Tax=Campylobacter sp. RM16190 TaxID=1705727 RepID=UPI001473B8AC|nr:radical SAM protein [Campylobacter sp. RM16190]